MSYIHRMHGEKGEWKNDGKYTFAMSEFTMSFLITAYGSMSGARANT